MVGKSSQIPFGETMSYKGLSTKIGNPDGMRAVGNANGHNRISIIIPCHRVIGEDGKLTGYGGGLHRKKWLLDFERETMEKIAPSWYRFSQVKKIVLVIHFMQIFAHDNPALQGGAK